MLPNLTEHINAEISLNTITNKLSAINWIKNTFMYICMKKSKNVKFKAKLDEELERICKEIFDNLKAINLISFEENYENIKIKPLGRKMSKNCVHFETMKVLNDIKVFR